MATVTIYKVSCDYGPITELGEGWSLHPWVDTDRYFGSDDGGRQYVVPAGAEIGRCGPDGEMMICVGAHGQPLFDTDGSPSIWVGQDRVKLRTVIDVIGLIAEECAEESVKQGLDGQLRADAEAFATDHDGAALDLDTWLSSIEPWEADFDAAADAIGRPLASDEDAAFCTSYRDELRRLLGCAS